MKSFSVGFVFSVGLLGNFSFAQSIKNILAKSTDDGKVVITYDLTGTAIEQKFTVSLYASHDNFNLPLSKVNGDIGKNITTGIGKKIEWDPSELGEFKGEINFRVKGEAMALPFVFKNPVEGSSVRRGKRTNVVWTGGRNNQTVTINLYQGDQKIQSVVETKNTGSYEWSLPTNLAKGKYTMKLDAGTQVVQSGEFTVKSKIPMLLKALPVLLVGGLVATLGGGGKKDNTQQQQQTGLSDLPAAPGPR